ncbi:MAG: ankyrin repeat domain-containing protein [Tabrizicola sp.]|nr:ankyrin repeat domain-containing protein [Tabrizicola sp.]
MDERKHALMANPQKYSGLAAVPPQVYRTWSYMSLRNHALIVEVDRLAAQARAKLVPYFIGKGIDSTQAENAVSRGLASITLGGKCGDNIVPRSFRSLLLDGASLTEITEFAESGAWRNADQLLPFQSCALFADMDPLAHIAVVDVRSFEYLRSIAALIPADDRTALDLILDIDARNEFGKTPLMTAAQFNKLDAVKWLLANGAAVNARTDAEGLGHGRRTPLMYAAASGSMEVIQTLLAAGADPYLADTTGQSAVDYLVGVTYEREPPNPILADEELKLAYRLLR